MQQVLFSLQLLRHLKAEICILKASVKDDERLCCQSPATNVLQEPLNHLVEGFDRWCALNATPEALDDVYTIGQVKSVERCIVQTVSEHGKDKALTNDMLLFWLLVVQVVCCLDQPLNAMLIIKVIPCHNQSCPWLPRSGF
jgi:hypothetical protein